MKRYNLVQKWMVRLLGECFIRTEKHPKWFGELSIYLAYCKKHGYYESYPQGHSKTLMCPKCLAHDEITRDILDRDLCEYPWEIKSEIKVS